MSDLSRLGNNLRYAENAASNYEPDADERDRKAEPPAAGTAEPLARQRR